MQSGGYRHISLSKLTIPAFQLTTLGALADLLLLALFFGVRLVASVVSIVVLVDAVVNERRIVLWVRHGDSVLGAAKCQYRTRCMVATMRGLSVQKAEADRQSERSDAGCYHEGRR